MTMARSRKEYQDYIVRLADTRGLYLTGTQPFGRKFKSYQARSARTGIAVVYGKTLRDVELGVKRKFR